MLVVFKQVIHYNFSTASSYDAVLQYTLNMPFCPQRLMEISNGDWECTIDSLGYHNGQLFAYTEADKTMYFACQRKESVPYTDKHNRQFEQVVKDYIDSGWKPSRWLCENVEYSSWIHTYREGK